MSEFSQNFNRQLIHGSGFEGLKKNQQLYADATFISLFFASHAQHCPKLWLQCEVHCVAQEGQNVDHDYDLVDDLV